MFFKISFSWTYLPVLVIIISVPSSWKRSHNSFVSKWHCTGFSSSQLQEPTIFGVFCTGSGVRRSSVSEPGDCGGVERPWLLVVLLFRWFWDELLLLWLWLLLLLLLLWLLVWCRRRTFAGGASSESLQSTTSTSTSSSTEMGPTNQKTETRNVIKAKTKYKYLNYYKFIGKH